MKKIVVKSGRILKEIIENADVKADLNHLDVSNLPSLAFAFHGTKFNGDISKWDVSNVENMSSMFGDSEFNGDISKWETGNVTNMEAMFNNAYNFNGDVSGWDVSKVKFMGYMFNNSKFKGDIWKWQVKPKCELGRFGVHNIESYDDFMKYAEPLRNKRKKTYKKVGSFADWLDI